MNKKIYTCKIECFSNDPEEIQHLVDLGLPSPEVDEKTVALDSSFFLEDVNWWKATLDEMYPLNIYMDNGLILRVHQVSFNEFNKTMTNYYESQGNS